MGIAGAGCSLASSLGADEVIDYRGKSAEELTSAIAAAAGGKIRHAFDCISEGGTLEAISAALGKNGGGQVTFVLAYSDEVLAALPRSVQAGRTMVAEAYGGDAEFATKWFAEVGKWLEAGSFKAQKVTVIPGGLSGVEEGLRRLRNNEVRSEKFVYLIKDTPGV